MTRLAGRVALVTGAARGIGRAQAVRLAAEGADVIGIDLLGPVESVDYPPATTEDLDETAGQVRAQGRRFLARQADVRDLDAMHAAVEAALAEFGRLDIVCATAGIATHGPSWQLSPTQWRDMLDVNLTGVYHSVKPAVPAMIEAGRGGSIVLVSSTAGLRPIPGVAHYTAAKHGVVGLMKNLALELAPHRIRVNTVNPTNVATPMILNDRSLRLFRPDLDAPTAQDAEQALGSMIPMPIPYVEPEDVAAATAFLASDDARYITGTALPVDGGACLL